MFKFETAWPQLWDNLLFYSLAMDTFQKDARSIGNTARRENNTHTNHIHLAVSSSLNPNPGTQRHSSKTVEVHMYIYICTYV